MTRQTGTAIWWFIAISSVGVGSFTVADNLYFASKGYSVAVIGTLFAVFNVAVAVAEAPFSVLFDRKSDRLAIQIGNGVRTVALMVFFLSFGLVGDLTAEALAGVGAAAMSGTSTAYILNRLDGRGVDRQRRALARVTLIGSASSLVGGGIGAMLFHIEPRLIWLGGAACMAGAGLVLLVARDGRAPAHRDHEPIRSYLRGLAVLGRHPRTWLSICADAGLVAPLVLWQLRLDAGSLGAVLAGFVVMKAAASIGSRLVAGRTIARRTLLALVAANTAAIVVFAVSVPSAVIVVAFGVHVVTHIAISVYCAAEFQNVVPDGRRAGAGSLVSLLSSFVTGGAAVLVGYLADDHGTLIAVLPSLFLYGAVAALAMMRRPAGR